MKERTAYRAAALGTTQVRYPWRATVRTVVWAAVAFSGMWALLVEAAGIPGDLEWVTASLAVTGAINRIAALPAVEAFLKAYLPWLAAAPPEKGLEARSGDQGYDGP